MTRGSLVTAFIAELAAQIPEGTRPGHRSKQSAAAKAAAFRIWADNNQHGWDRGLADVAETTGLPPERVMSIYNRKGWTHHLRRQAREIHPGQNLINQTDSDLDALEGALPWPESA